MITETIRLMVEVDPEAFGVDDPYEPRLGCASTGQLLTELDARLDPMIEGMPVGAQSAVEMVRDALPGFLLAYRTIDS